jgi:hypothetical protein
MIMADPCAGFESDPQSLCKIVADNYIATECDPSYSGSLQTMACVQTSCSCTYSPAFQIVRLGGPRFSQLNVIFNPLTKTATVTLFPAILLGMTCTYSYRCPTTEDGTPTGQLQLTKVGCV